MDTTSGVLAHILHMLAEHQDVQERLREEIRGARGANDGEDLSYEQLSELPLLDAVCRETLRSYVHFLTDFGVCGRSTSARKAPDRLHIR